MNDSEKNVRMFVFGFYQQVHSQHWIKLCYSDYSCEHAPILERAVGCFPYLTQSMFLCNSKLKKCMFLCNSKFTAFTACKSKSNVKIFAPSLIKKRLFCDICCKLLIISLSSNKLGNIFNCDINLLMPISSQLFSNKRVLSCNFLATNNNF